MTILMAPTALNWNFACHPFLSISMEKLCLKAELILLSMEAEKFSYKAVSANMLLEMTLRQ